MKVRRTVLAMVAGAALLVPAMIWAQGHFGPGMGMGMEGGGFGMGPMNVLRLAHRLGLSSGQITQIRGIVSAARTANQPIRQELKANRHAFEASYNPAQFDASAVNAYIAQQTPLVQQLMVSRFKTEASILAVLTPSQLTQYDQLIAQFKTWRQSRPRL